MYICVSAVRTDLVALVRFLSLMIFVLVQFLLISDYNDGASVFVVFIHIV